MSNPNAERMLALTGYKITFRVADDRTAYFLAEMMPALLGGSVFGCAIDPKTREVTIWREQKGASYDG